MGRAKKVKPEPPQTQHDGTGGTTDGCRVIERANGVGSDVVLDGAGGAFGRTDGAVYAGDDKLGGSETDAVGDDDAVVVKELHVHRHYPHVVLHYVPPSSRALRDDGRIHSAAEETASAGRQAP
ncbi:unnamed protein product [Cuscuta campestris]|uniref:Uncharacterized protein n=1 Tax=Cuscuta campestris TaxID=132261 RepID=A0A484KBR9_9ASTE|nr:unnamed protein product [Cuscuta campestris]